MTGWEPATEAEVAMWDALRAQDQQSYFRILARIDLLLPVSGPAPAGQAPQGWGTWTTGGRTHVLAFTSSTALRACLGESAGATRRVPYADLAAGWPDHEWWLAVNPGLPIEGYLPAWYVAQLSRGDVRLPGRTMGARARLERVENAARARAGAEAPVRDVPPPSPGASGRAAPVAPGAGSRAPSEEPATVPFSSAPPPRPSAEPPMPPIPRRPQPANGHLTADRLGPPGRRATDDGPSGLATRPASDPVAAGRPTPDPGSDALSGWITDLRRRPDEPDAFDAAGGPGAPAPPPARSFFEPSSGRTPRRPSPLDPTPRSGAVPPSRFARGGQPFPRRRPLNEPVPEEPTRAFRTDPEATQALRPTAEGPPRPFRPAPAPPDAAEQALPRRRPRPAADDRTQPIPTGSSGLGSAGAEELPPSAVEPVPGPSASRRGLSPIVIEGTVIESRDLTGPQEPARRKPGVGPAAAESPGAPTVPTTAAPAPTYRADDDGSGTPLAGATDPTVSLTLDPPTASLTVDPPTVSLTVDPPAAPVEPAPAADRDETGERSFAPSALSGEQLFTPRKRLDGSTDAAGERDGTPSGAPDERVTPPAGTGAADGSRGRFGRLFEPPEPPPEPTVPLFGRSATASEEPTTAVFAPADGSAQRSGSLFEPAARTEPAGSDGEPTVSLSAPSELGEPTVSWSAPVEPTVSLSAPSEPAEPTVSWSASVEPTVSLSAPSEPAGSLFASAQAAGAAAEPTVPVFTPTEQPAEPTVSLLTPVATPAFVPANGVEEELLGAAGSGSTDGFLSTLLLARVLLPVAADSAPGSRPGDPGFVWHTEQLDGGTYVVVYTSPERLADRADGPVDTVRVKFVQLIRRWPEENWSFAVNPGTPVGATYPGEQVLALANWAAEVGLGDDPDGEPEQPTAEAERAATTRPAPAVDPTRPVTMQKAIAPSQLAYYLERGYDRVSGFVHRASELAHLTTPTQLYDALGLGYPDSPFSRDAEEIYVLRWPAYRPSLYRIPYGGQSEAAMRAMEGWVIERPPFRGNGFAPGESSDVVAEFKVDSARLPHGAQLCRIGADGTERLVATLDTDALLWRQVGAS